jgi:hypothetical protein
MILELGSSKPTEGQRNNYMDKYTGYSLSYMRLAEEGFRAREQNAILELGGE